MLWPRFVPAQLRSRCAPRGRALVLGAALTLPMLGGCGKLDELVKAADQSAPIEFDMDQLTREFETRVSAAAAAPAVEQAAAACFDKVASQPEVAASGERLLGALAESPKLASVGEAVIGTLGESPRLQQIVMEMMQSNPGMTPDAVGVAMEKRIEGVTGSPEFDRAFDQSFDKVLAAPEVVKAFNGLETAIANNPYLVGIINGSVNEAEYQASWTKRLTELNGGKRPSTSEATTLLLDNWFTPERLERFYIELFALPVTQTQLTIAVVELVESPALVSHLSVALESVASDPNVQQQIVDVLNTLLLDQPSEAAILAVLDPLLTQPAFAPALAGFVDALVQDPTLAPIGVKTLEAIANDASVRALVKQLLTDW